VRTATALRAYALSVARLRRWLQDAISFEEARARVAQRLRTRDESFLNLIRRCVFGNPRSPYLPLFRQAGCEHDDLVRGIRQHGLEEELRRLKDAGVWISLDEFKGRVPIVRGDVELRRSPSDFDNPAVSPVVAPQSGGSSGRSVRSSMDLDHLAVRASYEAFGRKLAGLYGVPLAVWFPQLPAASGIVSTLQHAKIGQPPVRWFDIECGSRSSPGWQGKLLTAGLVAASRASSRPLASPEPGPVCTVLDWILRTRDHAGRCGVHTYVSRAVRASQAARNRGSSLENVAFYVGAEPLTQARCDEIRAAGASVFPRYASTEMGTIAIGCVDSREAGDHHLCRDLVAVVQADLAATDQADILYMTALHEVAPKVMINVQLGDCARVVRRRCGCLLGEMGLDLHLLQVRSIERVTCEGMTVAVSELVRIVEEVLCRRYGGSALDYQWAEQEDRRGKARLLLRIGPVVGALDQDRIIQEVLSELARRSRSGPIVADTWREARTIQVVRDRPRATLAGKQLPFLRTAEP
jgi:hypothetical protein